MSLQLLSRAACALVGALALVQPAAAQGSQIRFGTTVQPGHPISQGATKFGELVSAKTGGKLKSKEFAASALGVVVVSRVAFIPAPLCPRRTNPRASGLRVPLTSPPDRQ